MSKDGDLKKVPTQSSLRAVGHGVEDQDRAAEISEKDRKKVVFELGGKVLDSRSKSDLASQALLSEVIKEQLRDILEEVKSEQNFGRQMSEIHASRRTSGLGDVVANQNPQSGGVVLASQKRSPSRLSGEPENQEMNRE